MYSIVLNQPLYGYGMDILEKETRLFVAHSNDVSTFIGQLQEADAIIVRGCRLDRETLKQCPGLKVAALPGVGYQDWDLEALTEYGVPLVYCPGTNGRSVAEHTIAMLYALAKSIPERNNESKNGHYAIRNKFSAVELEGRTVGVVGFGNIGKQVARLLIGNGLKVRVYDPYVDKGAVEAADCVFEGDLAQMLPNCDAITLHVPYLPETIGMLGREQFAAMKDGAYIINCARGSLIDEEALYEALAKGKLGGAALDVMNDEPFDTANLLFGLPNVIITPHVAGVTQEASSRTYGMAVTSTLAALNGERVSNVANPDAFLHPKWK